MISSISGEVSFDDGLRIAAHQKIDDFLQAVVSSHAHPVPGWHQYIFGFHLSEHGRFQVEVAVNGARRIQSVFLSHCDPLYHKDAPDPVRRDYHARIILADLTGQSEFLWGQIMSKFDIESKREWLIVIYKPFLDVPLHPPWQHRHLAEHEPDPATGE